jgi:hypothetical protein
MTMTANGMVPSQGTSTSASWPRALKVSAPGDSPEKTVWPSATSSMAPRRMINMASVTMKLFILPNVINAPMTQPIAAPPTRIVTIDR